MFRMYLQRNQEKKNLHYMDKNDEYIDRLNIPLIVFDMAWIFPDYLKYPYTCIMKNSYSIVTTDKIENSTRTN